MVQRVNSHTRIRRGPVTLRRSQRTQTDERCFRRRPMVPRPRGSMKARPWPHRCKPQSRTFQPKIAQSCWRTLSRTPKTPTSSTHAYKHWTYVCRLNNRNPIFRTELVTRNMFMVCRLNNPTFGLRRAIRVGSTPAHTNPTRQRGAPAMAPETPRRLTRRARRHFQLRIACRSKPAKRKWKDSEQVYSHTGKRHGPVTRRRRQSPQIDVGRIRRRPVALRQRWST
jgi:hypothetical protein